MRGSEKHFVFPRTEECAGRLSCSRRDAVDVSRGEIQSVDLVEGIVGFALTFKDERLAIGREITFSAATPLEDELSDVGKESGLVFVLFGPCVHANEAEAEREKEQSCEIELHEMILGGSVFLRVPQPRRNM